MLLDDPSVGGGDVEGERDVWRGLSAAHQAARHKNHGSCHRQRVLGGEVFPRGVQSVREAFASHEDHAAHCAALRLQFRAASTIVSIFIVKSI